MGGHAVRNWMLARLILATTAIGLALAVGVASADTPQAPPGSNFYLRDYAEITSSAPEQPWWSLTFDLVVKLGLVIGLIYLTTWALRTYVFGPQARRQLGGATGVTGKIGVLESTNLAPNRSIYLVEVADRVLVLGATATTLSTLAEITEPSAIDLLKKSNPEPEPGPSFADQFRALTDHLPAAAGRPSFLGDKISELRALAGHMRRPAVEDQAEMERVS